LLKSGKHPSKILVTEKWLRKNQNLSKKFDESLINIVSEEVLASAISTINPDGIAALVEIQQYLIINLIEKMILFLFSTEFKILGIWVIYLEPL